MTNQRRLAREVCPLLGISVPVVGAPMGGVAGPELAAAVSQAGGLGMLGHANTSLDDVRAEIRAVRELTDQPFGVGLLFPVGEPAELPDGESAEPVTRRPELPEFLRPLLETAPASAGLSTSSTVSPAQGPARRFSRQDAHRRLDIVLEENVPVLACGLDTPAGVVQRAKAHGLRVISLVGSRRAAVEVAARGVDVIVAQGHEAGGHTGRTATFVLTPQVADAVSTPVLTAGGVMDGRGLAAALMLGASGVLLGTRLLATPEARTARAHKESVVAMVDDTTVVSRCYTGKPSRVLRNAFTDAWRGHEASILPMPRQWSLVEPLVAPAKTNGSLQVANWPTGQGAVLAPDVTPAAEAVRRIVDQAAALLPEHPALRGARSRPART